jgi:enoyl-CoA hydratase/carnithine racemase
VSDILLTKREDGVLWLTLNRPERKNSVSPELRDELLAELEEARADEEVR